jgi:hypothetical protein
MGGSAPPEITLIYSNDRSGSRTNKTMKRCPTCDKTFDDAMRFCQSDGTPLVEDAPVDPYKTMVASQDDIAAALKDMKEAKETPPAAESEDVLQIPEEEDDPRKTMVASKEEIDQVLSEEPAMEIPPMAKAPEPPVKAAEPTPEPPPFIAPVEEKPKASSMPPVSAEPPKPFEAPKPAEPPKAPEPPKTPTPPPSPFDSEHIPDFSMTTPPIPSPFNEPKAPDFIDPKPIESKPAPPAAPMAASPGSSNPFDAPSAPQAPAGNAPAEWKPPAPPEPAWQGQGLGKDTPFQPPAVKGPSSVMAIISLVLALIGLISVLPTILILFCGILPLGLGLAAIIVGFLARSRAKKDPEHYGGSGLAMAGILLGILAFIAPIAITVLMFVFYGALMALPR